MPHLGGEQHGHVGGVEQPKSYTHDDRQAAENQGTRACFRRQRVSTFLKRQPFANEIGEVLQCFAQAAACSRLQSNGNREEAVFRKTVAYAHFGRSFIKRHPDCKFVREFW